MLRAMDHVAAGLPRGRRPRAPHGAVDGRRRHLAHRPALPRPLRLDLAGVRRRRHGPHALDGGLERARPGAHGPHRRHAASPENAANLQVFVFHGDEDDAVTVDRLAEDDGGLREGRARRASAHYFELPGVTHFSWDFAYRDAGAVPARRADPPQPVPRARRLLDVLAALQQGLLAAHRPDRPRHRARPRRGDAEGGRLRREGRQRLRPLPAALSRDRARREADRGAGERQARLPGHAEGRRPEPRRRGRASWKGTSPWRGPAQGPPDHAEADFRSGGLAQHGPHVYVYGTIGDEATTAASKAGGRDAGGLGAERARARGASCRTPTSRPT